MMGMGQLAIELVQRPAIRTARLAQFFHRDGNARVRVPQADRRGGAEQGQSFGVDFDILLRVVLFGHALPRFSVVIGYTCASQLEYLAFLPATISKNAACSLAVIGPRLPVYHFWKANVYAKALYGFSKMNFDPQGDHGTFSTIAFGGGMDVQLTKKLSFRAVDIEYQDWPAWGNSSIKPYGASMGVGYRFF